jgi:hypothetical protein
MIKSILISCGIKVGGPNVAAVAFPSLMPAVAYYRTGG